MVAEFFQTNVKNLCFAVQIEKTEVNILQKEWEMMLLYFFKMKRKTIFESH